jgi:hypothetical protein
MRARAAFLAVLLAAGGAVALDQASPARPRVPAGFTVPAQGGALACPIAVADKGTAYLDLANFSDEASRVRVSLIPPKGKTQVLGVSMPGGTINTIRLSSRVPGTASAVVEYVGGEVVASHLLLRRFGPGPTGIAEAPCVRTGGPDVAVLPARTLNTQTTLALFNPGSADADVTVSIVSDKQTLRPVRLSHLVIRGRTRRDFNLGDYAFDSPSVVAKIHATTGRVVAEGLVLAPNGIELLTGSEAASAVVAITGASAVGSGATVVPMGVDDTALGAQLLATDAHASVARAPATVDPSAGANLPFPARPNGGPAAFSFTATAGSPVVAGALWPEASAKGRDFGAVAGVAPARRWGFAGAVGGGSGALNLLVACPGGQSAKVRVLVLTSKGRTTLDLAVGAGRMARARLANHTGGFGVLVESDQPVAAVLQTLSVDPRAGILSDGIAPIPLRPSAPVAPEVDPRVGVPAPLQR